VHARYDEVETRQNIVRVVQVDYCRPLAETIQPFDVSTSVISKLSLPNQALTGNWSPCVKFLPARNITSATNLSLMMRPIAVKHTAPSQVLPSSTRKRIELGMPYRADLKTNNLLDQVRWILIGHFT